MVIYYSESIQICFCQYYPDANPGYHWTVAPSPCPSISTEICDCVRTLPHLIPLAPAPLSAIILNIDPRS